MNLMFWKKKKPDAEQDAADHDHSVAIPREAEAAEEAGEGSVRPGLLARLRNALASRRKPHAPDAEAGTPDTQEKAEPHFVPQRNMKKRLVIGGAIGFIVLLLAGIGFAVWKIFLSHPEPAPAATQAAHASPAAQHAETPDAETPHAGMPETEIEALKKKNQELQAQIEAIKSEQAQQESAASQTRNNGAAKTSIDAGEITLSNKDPKAAAQALKEAIEAMNGQKPVKPAR